MTGSPETGPDSAACTVFLLAAFSLAGLVQTAWLRSSASNRFAVPLDYGADISRQANLRRQQNVEGPGGDDSCRRDGILDWQRGWSGSAGALHEPLAAIASSVLSARLLGGLLFHVG